MKKTALYSDHVQRGAKMTEFHGWDMPLYYTSILDEHQAVRNAVGLFDISHMGQVLVKGQGAVETLNELVVSDISQVGLRRACYTMFVNEQGKILDDIIVYALAPEEYMVIINCAMREADVRWLQQHPRGKVKIQDLSDGRSIVAAQGPAAVRALEQTLHLQVAGLGRFELAPVHVGEQAWVARTGYTGSDGFELFLQDAHAVRVWRQLLDQGNALGACPIGLGARDTLRLEAGLRLYGTDMDHTTSPYEAGLGWTVAINKPSFLGKAALVKDKSDGVARTLIGFQMGQGPLPRHGCPITRPSEEQPIGHVTSGTFSPMLNACIGMGYVETAAAKPGTTLAIVIRNKAYPSTVVKMPFWQGMERRAQALSAMKSEI